jgi:hypothetical protein
MALVENDERRLVSGGKALSERRVRPETKETTRDGGEP